MSIPSPMPAVGAVLLAASLFACHARASTCYGTVGNGRIEGAVQLPSHGRNFVSYSALGVELGRTYVHSLVRNIVLDAYARLEKVAPDKIFVYGETGLAHGGRMPPHRTHQSGLSVDFMVPVVDDGGRSVPLPSTPLNKFGYGLEFDDRGRLPGLRIDFDSMAEHLYQISIAAKQRSITIDRVIFDRAILQKLLNTSLGQPLRNSIPFMTARPWIRHDEHYHIDFGVPCAPLEQ